MFKAIARSLAVALGVSLPSMGFALTIEFTGGTVIDELGETIPQFSGDTENLIFNSYSERGYSFETQGSMVSSGELILSPAFVGAYYQDVLEGPEDRVGYVPYGEGSGTGSLHSHDPGSVSVLHTHFEDTSSVLRLTKQGGGRFDFNYFVLTSNTAEGGGPAEGTEDVYIVASQDGVAESFRALLPSEDWGTVPGVFANRTSETGVREIYLGPEFNDVTAIWFESDEAITVCFGMDKLHIDSFPPRPSRPDPVILGSGTIEDVVRGEIVPVPLNFAWFVLALMALIGTVGGIRGYAATRHT